MAATLVTGQQASNFNAAGDTTPSATLPSAATAGNLLVWITSGDKDLGTFTQPSGFTTAVYLHTANVSLAMCWKTAAGGETTIAGSATGANTSGSETYVGEYSETGSGAWESKATAGTGTDDGSNVTARSTGTTGTTSSAGLAIAAWAVDSTNTEGSASYTNSYTERVNPLGLGDTGEAGLWVAELAVGSGVTTTCTLTRSGGVTSDQMCGGVIVLGRVPAAGPSVAQRTGGFLGLLAA